MRRIVSDNDVRGYVARLVRICESDTWREFWRDLDCVVYTFGDLELSADSSDAEVWRACQAGEAVLITANRHADEEDSLEATIRRSNNPTCLPVLTLSDPRRIRRDREYAELVAERLLEILIDIDLKRGTGRLYLP